MSEVVKFGSGVLASAAGALKSPTLALMELRRLLGQCERSRLKPGLQTRKAARLLVPCSIVLVLFACLPSTNAHAQETQQKTYRFCTVDIYVDSGSTPLAAYQLEFSVTNGLARIAGIEGGEHPAFRTPPYYDPKAIQNDRVIVAAFSLGYPQQLPTGRTRVATIHLMVSGNTEPQFELKLQAAADPDGKKISVAQATIERKESK